MAQRTVNPAKIKTLADWVERWTKGATNLGFDPETREPTIYDVTKERAKVSSIPWKREADVLTVLAQPARFSAKAVEVATGRYTKIQEQRLLRQKAGEEQLRAATAALMDAWRAFNAAPAAVRGSLRHDILAAELAVREIELALADKGRRIMMVDQGYAVYVPPMPVTRRGLTIEETA